MKFRDFSIRHNSGKDICFQVIDWYQTDFEDSEDKRAYVIKLFGVDESGHSVCLNVTGFEPYFYISKESGEMTMNEITIFKNKLINGLSENFKECVSFQHVRRKSVYGFTNNQKKQYIKLSFTNLMCMYIVRKRIKNMNMFEFHESNIDPFLRFVHMQDLKPCGWVIAKQAVDVLDEYDDMKNTEYLTTKCQINAVTSYANVEHYECVKVAPVVILSFDIECTSSNGDFPMPIKTYKRTAEEIVEAYNYLKPNTFLSKIDNYNWNDSDFQKLLPSLLLEMFGFAPESRLELPEKIRLNKVHVKSKKHLKAQAHSLRAKIQDPAFVAHIVDVIKRKRPENECSPTQALESFLNQEFPPLKGDAIIQIGSTVHTYGESECSYKNIITLDTCDEIPGVDVVACKTEKRLLEEWCKLIDRIDPDVITGYNILGFDFTYMYHRALELGCDTRLLQTGRLESHVSQFKEKTLSSSALGDNLLKYIDMEGRVIIDLMKVIQREYKLDTYKLDNVAPHFISGKILEPLSANTIRVDSATGLNTGDYIKVNDIKYMIQSMRDNTLTLDGELSANQPIKTWGLAKDDLSPKEIFMCQTGTSSDRAKVAKYCVQDCSLCNMLIIKLEVFANNMGMANVCLVPLSYIFMRGQGVKIFSLVLKQCNDDGFVFPVIKCEDDEDEESATKKVGYEGAIVLDPTPGIYKDTPISVMDYASLYPSSMISENISHDSIVNDPKYDNLEGIEYVDITYDVFSGVGDKKKKNDRQAVCRFAQFPNNEKGILPRILMKLLSQRKLTRKKMTYQEVETNTHDTYVGVVQKRDDRVDILTSDGNTVRVQAKDVLRISDHYNEFMKAVLDGLQLAYKITANSLYGQVGARTSPIYMKELAASTTATGRNLIMKAKSFMEKHYDAKVIYGDTDSIFVDFTSILRKAGLSGKDALQKSIDIAVEASSNFKETLKAPHDLEYEKTFYPFIILSKKKYVGNLYEFDVNKYKQKSMGIVLKRRDNANIVKLIYGGLINILLSDHDIYKAIDFLQTSLKDLIDGKFTLEDLIITKTLRSFYKDPTKIAHKTLAERMRERDPGSAPQVNDRVQYIYVEHDRSNKNLLQGDKIEDPTYIKEKSLKIDYMFYITNQLMKPICQLLSVALFDIPKCKRTQVEYDRLYRRYVVQYQDEKKAKDKIADVKQLEVQKLLFDDIFRQLDGKGKQTEITDYVTHSRQEKTDTRKIDDARTQEEQRLLFNDKLNRKGKQTDITNFFKLS